MTQYIGDLLARATLLEQAARQGVSKDVNAGMGQTATKVCCAHSIANHVWTNWDANRGNVPDKHATISRARTLIAKVLGNSNSGSLRQRQQLRAAGLVLTDAKGSSNPVDVVETDVYNFTGSQTQIDSAADHGVSTARRWQFARERAEQPGNLGLGQCLW